MKKIVTYLFLLPAAICAQSFGSGFNFNLPWNDSTTQKFLPKFPAAVISPANFVKADAEGNFSLGGKKIKFWGTNLVADGAFPPKDKAAQISARMRKMGINLVRMHHLDNPWSSYSLLPGSYSTSRDIASSNRDLLEYLIAKLKENGLFINMNLNVSRKFHPMDGVMGADSLWNYGTDYLKGITLFDPYLIMLQKEFALQLLTHINPYTGKSLADDPVMAMLETNNENSLYRLWQENQLKLISRGGKLIYRHVRMLDSLFNKYISDKYKTTSVLKEFWNQGKIPFGQNEQIKNPGFEDVNINTNWEVEQNGGAKANFERNLISPFAGSASANISVNLVTGTDWHIQFKQKTLTVKKDSLYTVAFAARSNIDQDISVSVMSDLSPWTWYSGIKIALTQNWKVYSFSFKASEDNIGHTRLSFSLGGKVSSFGFDEISFTKAGMSGLKNDESIEAKNIQRIDFSECVSYSDQRVKDISEFYIKLQSDYFSDMINYLHNVIGVKVPIVGTNWSVGASDNASISVSDYIDNHSYWDHPQFPNIPWSSTDWLINNSPMVKDDFGGTIPGLFAGIPMAGKPFTISEYNHAFPNIYQSESLLFLTGYSSFHNADAVMLFDYSGERTNWEKDFVNGYFDTHRNSVYMALYPSCAIAFRNSLIDKAKTTIKINYQPDTYLLYPKSAQSNWRGVLGYDQRLSLKYGVRTESYKSNIQTDFSSLPPIPKSPYTTDTDQIIYNTIDGVYTINSGKFFGASGYLSSLINKNNSNCTITGFQSGDFGTITWVSLTNEILSNSQLSLITLVSKIQNSNMIWTGIRSVGNQWGSAPTQLYPLRIKLDLKIFADSIKVYPLDSKGAESSSNVFIVKPSAANHFTVELDQNIYRSLWFGIEKIGNGSPTSSKEENNLPSEFKLEQNYPNPFNPSTVISYQLSAVSGQQSAISGQQSAISGQQSALSRVTLKIYDVLGKEVATLVNEDQPAGKYSVEFRVSPSGPGSKSGEYASGVYYYRLKAGNFVQTRKMMLVK